MFYTLGILTELIYIIMLRFWGIYKAIIIVVIIIIIIIIVIIYLSL